MNNIVNLKDGLITFNSNIDNSLTFSKCAIGFANDNDEVYERGSIVFLTNNNQDNTSVSILTDVKMSINSAGNVGIGSLNASENKLEVDGNISLSSGNTYKINNFPLAYSNLAGDVPVENLPLGDNLLINNNKISVNLDYYTGDSTINGDLIITSNLIVNGQSMQLNKTEFSTEKIDIANLGIGPSLRISQVSEINNILNISNYTNTEIFNITKDGHINFTEQINGIDKIQFSKIANIDSNNTNCSNYVETASNSLFADYTARFTEVSSIIDSNNANCSNYVETASNSLFTDYIARNIEMNDRLISEISTYVGYASNYVDVNKLTEGNNINIINNAISANLGLYNGNAVINGSLTVNSDLIINGTTTTVDTRDYLTNIFTASNVGPGPTLSITQTSQINNIVNVSNYLDSEVFNITVDGYINFTERINGINKMQFSKIANIDTNDSNCSNFIRASSNILFGDYVERDNFTSNFVSTNSNILFGDYVARDQELSTSLTTEITSSIGYVSNYIDINKYTDDKVKNVLSTAAGNNIVWNNETKQFDTSSSGDYNSLANKLTAGNSINIDANNIVSVDLVYYQGDATINGDLIVNSNLIVNGQSLQLNTTSYSTEKLDIINIGDGTSLSIKQSLSANNNNIINVSNYANSEVFNMTKDGYINFTERINDINVMQFSKIANIDSNDGYVSNYIAITSNLIFTDYTGRLDGLSSAVTTKDGYTSNYVSITSNLIFTDYTGRLATLSSTVTANDGYTSNYVSITSNLIFTDYTGRLATLSSAVTTKDGYTSNYVSITSNLIFTDYTGRLAALSSTVTANDGYTSNYIDINKYTDTKVKTVLATSAGNNMVWNNTTKRFDVPFNGDYNSLTNKLTAGHNINIDANNIVSAVLDIYNGDTTINGNLTVNSNLVVIGTTTTLNTSEYSTEKLDILNAGIGPTLSVIQTSQVNNIVNVSNYLDKEVFNITSEGHINFSEKINDIDKIQFSKIANIDANDSYCSNFVRISNDILFLDYSTKIDDLTLYVDANDSYTSNYVRILDDLQYLDYSDKINNLSATVEGNNVNVSNYVNITSNLLFADYVERDRFASNLLFADYVARDTYTSNYVDITSNTLVTDYVARITSLASASISGSAWTISNSNIYNNNTNNVGIGTTDPSAYKLQVTGSIGATGDITASYSDERLKSITEQIKDVLPTLNKINGFRYICNDIGSKYGYDENKKELGLSAQEIQKYYPELVTLAPFDSAYDSETNKIISKSGENYLTLKYERLVPVLLQGIKELNMHVENIRANDVKKDIELKELRERIILIEERLDKINQIE